MRFQFNSSLIVNAVIAGLVVALITNKLKKEA